MRILLNMVTGLFTFFGMSSPQEAAHHGQISWDEFGFRRFSLPILWGMDPLDMDQIDIGLLMGCSDSQIPWFVYPTRFVINMVLTWLFSRFWNANF